MFMLRWNTPRHVPDTIGDNLNNSLVGSALSVDFFVFSTRAEFTDDKQILSYFLNKKMARHKEKLEVHHDPSTIEIFLCIASMPKWAKLLIEAEPTKPYVEMLKELSQKNFYSDRNEKLTIKKISTDLKINTAKITKWFTAIYQDIFDLNETKPELFYEKGIAVTLYLRNFDDSEAFRISVSALPREYEMFRFYFAKAKMGIEYYWVYRIEHSIEEDNYEICIWLRGGFANKYREILYDKAMFYNEISLGDTVNKSEYEIDNELRKIYKG